eukprot:240563-Pelagomonas_calceolata.AAC.1
MQLPADRASVPVSSLPLVSGDTIVVRELPGPPPPAPAVAPAMIAKRPIGTVWRSCGLDPLSGMTETKQGLPASLHKGSKWKLLCCFA